MAVNFRAIDLNLLRVFDEVMSERNITRAARNLAMTQPAVSNALRRLRDLLGDELLVRSGYGVEPTPHAHTLWPVVRQALASLHEAMAPEGFDAATAQQNFVLSMADATATQLIPRLVALIERSAPGIGLRLTPLTTRDPRPLLDSGHIELAIGHFPGALAAITAQGVSVDRGPAFGHERLYEYAYVCNMRRAHPLAHAPLTLDAFCNAHHLLVSFSGRAFGLIDEALAALGKSRRVVVTVNQFFTAGKVVVDSDLLSVLPRHFVQATGMARDLAVRELPMQVADVHVDMLWHRRQHMRPAHVWLRKAVAQAARAAFVQQAVRDAL
ncbi:MAG: LysR family transcriptional regulator [Burkholderiaceae bacterium]